MNWYQITIHTVSEAVEALSYYLEEELGIRGVEIQDPKDILMAKKDPKAWDYVDEELFAGRDPDEVLVSIYLSFASIKDHKELENILLKVQDKLNEIRSYLPVGSGKIDISIRQEEDWENAWKQYYQPFYLAERIHIVPTWIDETEYKEGEIRITMDPGMAFGTGTHETTSMCVELLSEVLHGGERVFDIGCGSGILGIAAAGLGAADVICSDLDGSAVQVARENVLQNQLQDTVRVYKGDLLDVEAFAEEKADVVVSNIIADVIMNLSSQIGPLIKDHGYFICSGIIQERKEDVLKTLKTYGFTVEEVRDKGSWTAIRSRKTEKRET